MGFRFDVERFCDSFANGWNYSQWSGKWLDYDVYTKIRTCEIILSFTKDEPTHSGIAVPPIIPPLISVETKPSKSEYIFKNFMVKQIIFKKYYFFFCPTIKQLLLLATLIFA